MNVYPTEEQADALAALLQARAVCRLDRLRQRLPRGHARGARDRRAGGRLGAHDWRGRLLEDAILLPQIVRVRPDALVRLRGDPAATALFVGGDAAVAELPRGVPGRPARRHRRRSVAGRVRDRAAADALAGVDGWREVARFSVRRCRRRRSSSPTSGAREDRDRANLEHRQNTRQNDGTHSATHAHLRRRWRRSAARTRAGAAGRRRAAARAAGRRRRATA